jgi:hypothetical protein
MHLEILDDWCCICIGMPVFVPNLSILLIMFSLALPACDDLDFQLTSPHLPCFLGCLPLLRKSVGFSVNTNNVLNVVV